MGRPLLTVYNTDFWKRWWGRWEQSPLPPTHRWNTQPIFRGIEWTANGIPARDIWRLEAKIVEDIEEQMVRRLCWDGKVPGTSIGTRAAAGSLDKSQINSSLPCQTGRQYSPAGTMDAGWVITRETGELGDDWRREKSWDVTYLDPDSLWTDWKVGLCDRPGACWEWQAWTGGLYSKKGSGLLFRQLSCSSHHGHAPTPVWLAKRKE